MQKLLSEFIGTFTLIFVGTGSICADQYLHATGGTGVGCSASPGVSAGDRNHGHGDWPHLRRPPQSSGNDRFLGDEKNQHGRRAGLLDFTVAGATFAAYLLTVVIPESTWRAVALGTPDLAPDFTRFHAIVLEAITTFLLVFVVFATAADPKGAFNKIAGFAIGLTITMDILVAGPFTGAAINPARAFGPALVGHHWMNHGVYWVGPLIGGVIAGWLYNSFLLKES